MYWGTSLVLVCLIVTQARCEHGQYGFVNVAIVKQCISNPINDICPLDHKVPKLPIIFFVFIRDDLSQISASFHSAGGNENCTEAAKMFECSRRIQTCRDNLTYYYLDSARAHKLCMTARNACAEVDGKLQDRLLNCQKVENRGDDRIERRWATCMEYPKWENDRCPMQNYKVVDYVDLASNVRRPSFVQDQNTFQRLLRDNNVEKNCSNAIFGAFCEASAPACTKDEQYEVSFLGKQKCYQILGCLNNTKLYDTINRHYLLCINFPDEDTAKKISITQLSANPPTTTPTNTTKEITVPCCNASTLSAKGYILVVFTVWFFLSNCVK